MILALRLQFQNTTDQIMLGAVRLEIGSTTECVETITALRALNAGAAPCLSVLGYHTAGAGGGGDFYWEASAAEPDNAGTIIVPTSNPPVGRWKRLVSDPLSVAWFGAKADGLTDDFDAIEATLAAAKAVVTDPLNTYRLKIFSPGLLAGVGLLCWTFGRGGGACA